jgi:hypothetical protein
MSFTYSLEGPSAAEWESREGHYRVRLYGAWIDVPDDALITEPKRTIIATRTVLEKCRSENLPR